MSRYHRIPSDVCADPLADAPELAMFVATLFERLGGHFEIDADGARRAVRPDREKVWNDGVPQFDDADEDERFASAAEWNGAIRMAEYWLNRLGVRDREMVFTALARTDEAAGPFDFRTHLAGD